MSLPHRSLAWLDLWRRYLKVFLHAWANRKALRTDYFNKEEAEFLPAALSLQEAPASRSLRWTARILMAMVVFALAWSLVGRMDIVVAAGGKVIASSHTKTIASVDVASVKAILVSEGQSVKAGDVLVELDASSSDAERDKAADAMAQARLQAARAAAMIQALESMQAPELPEIAGVTAAQWQSVRSQLRGQFEDVRAKLARFDDEIAHYRTALHLATQRASDYRVLMEEHSVSRHAWMEKEQARVDLQGQLTDTRNQRTGLITQSRKDAHDSRLEAEKIIEAAQQDRRRADEHSRLLKLVSPVDGTVQQLAVHTVGGVVPAAQPLMQVVPQGSEVEVEALLENKDVGFVEIGQRAEVKIDAFDYTKYGTVPARVIHVSRDAIPDEKKGLIYSARVVLDKNSLQVDGRQVAISPGLSVNVEIKTGTRRVIEYVLSPLIRHQKEALHER